MTENIRQSSYFDNVNIENGILCSEFKILVKLQFSIFLAHLSRRLKSELIVYPCSAVRRCRRFQPFSNMNISETSRQIAIKFYLKHYWGGGKAAWGFGADQFRTLVSIATESSHRVIIGKMASSRFLECF